MALIMIHSRTAIASAMNDHDHASETNKRSGKAQGDQGFNNIQVDAARGQVAGCRETSGAALVPYGPDTVEIEVSDLGNIGCTSAESQALP
eukprot:3932133-Rhodomonas_salina.2